MAIRDLLRYYPWQPGEGAPPEALTLLEQLNVHRSIRDAYGQMNGEKHCWLFSQLPQAQNVATSLGVMNFTWLRTVRWLPLQLASVVTESLAARVALTPGTMAIAATYTPGETYDDNMYVPGDKLKDAPMTLLVIDEAGALFATATREDMPGRIALHSLGLTFVDYVGALASGLATRDLIVEQGGRIAEAALARRSEPWMDLAQAYLAYLVERKLIEVSGGRSILGGLSRCLASLQRVGPSEALDSLQGFFNRDDDVRALRAGPKELAEALVAVTSAPQPVVATMKRWPTTCRCPAAGWRLPVPTRHVKTTTNNAPACRPSWLIPRGDSMRS